MRLLQREYFDIKYKLQYLFKCNTQEKPAKCLSIIEKQLLLRNSFIFSLGWFLLPENDKKAWHTANAYFNVKLFHFIWFFIIRWQLFHGRATQRLISWHLEQSVLLLLN